MHLPVYNTAIESLLGLYKRGVTKLRCGGMCLVSLDQYFSLPAAVKFTHYYTRLTAKPSRAKYLVIISTPDPDPDP